MSSTDHFHTRSSASSQPAAESSFSYFTAATVAPILPTPATTWNAVPFNGIDYANSGVTASLIPVPPALTATYNVTLPFGKWRLRGYASAAGCGGSFQVRLATIEGIVLSAGNASHSASATVLARSDAEAVVEGPLSFQLQYYAAAASGTLGLANLSGIATHAKLTVTAL